jgi:hypothetical protein
VIPLGELVFIDGGDATLIFVGALWAAHAFNLERERNRWRTIRT